MMFLLFLTCVLTRSSADSHSIQHRYTEITAGTNFPEFTATGLLDGEQYIYYDSNNSLITKDWIKNIRGGDHLNNWIGDMKFHQSIIKKDLDLILKDINESEGIHTLQLMFGCEVNNNVTTRVYCNCGYDGEDFISLDWKNSDWTAANSKAKDFIRKLNMVVYIQEQKDFLKESCIKWLNSYVLYSGKTLERKVPPEVFVFLKSSPSQEKVCHATGFFPRDVMMTWQKDGEDLHEDVELRETLPNQDGSFQKRGILRVSPEDMQKHNYSCVVQHAGLRILRDGGADGVPIGIIVGVVVGVAALVACVAAILIWKKKKSGFRPVLQNHTELSQESSGPSNGDVDR